VLVCLDAETGAEKWRVDFPKRYGSDLPTFGFVCSPLVVGDALYVQAGGAFFKLDARTGESIWKSLADGGGMNGSAFSSPTLTKLGGVEQVLVQTRQKLAGVDPANGKVLWDQEIPTFRGMNILTPLVWNDSVLTSAYGGKTLSLRPTPASGSGRVETAWTNKAEGYMSTPVVVGDYAYLHLRNQRMTCIDLRDGSTKWITTPFGKYMSLVANGDKILALDERGSLVLFRANPQKFEQIDTLSIGDEDPWAHLAVCGDELFVRGKSGITAYRWKNEK